MVSINFCLNDYLKYNYELLNKINDFDRENKSFITNFKVEYNNYYYFFVLNKYYKMYIFI